MKNLKKILLPFLMLGLSIGVTSAIISNKQETQTVSADDELTEYEADAFVWFSGNTVVIHLSECDYTDGDPYTIDNAGVFNTYKPYFDDCGTWSNILINDKKVQFTIFNEDGIRWKRQFSMNVHDPKQTISLYLDFASEHEGVNSITLKEGLRLPSRAYLDSDTPNVYKIAHESVATPNANCNYGWQTLVDTEVYTVTADDNPYLALCLTINDFPSTTKDGSVKSGPVNFNDGTHLTITGTTITGAAYGLYYYRNQVDSIWINTGAGTLGTVTSVTVYEGLILTSYGYTKNGWPMYYRVTNEFTFTQLSDGVYNYYSFDEVETDVNFVKMGTIIGARYLTFGLTVSDYTTGQGSATLQSRLQFYNLFNSIKVILVNNRNEGSTPKEGKTFLSVLNDKNTGCFDYNGSNTNRVTFGLLYDSYASGSFAIEKICIPAGTEFPSYSYVTSNNVYNSVRPKAYVTKTDKYFWLVNGTFTETTIVDTTVDGITYNSSNTSLSFSIATNDYVASPASSVSPALISLNYATQISLSGVEASFKLVTSPNNRFQPSDSVDAFAYDAPTISAAIQLTRSSLKSGGTITISTGTFFPSYAFSLALSQSNTATPKLYRVSEDVTFKWNGTCFINTGTPSTKGSSITELEARSDGGTFANDNCCIDVYVDNFDWPGPSSVNDYTILQSGQTTDFSSLNTFSKIHFYHKNGTEISIYKLYVNVWGGHCFSFELTNALVSLTQNLDHVVIDDGIEFPAYNGEKFVVEHGATYGYDTKNHTFGLLSYDTTSMSIDSVEYLNASGVDKALVFNLGGTDWPTRSAPFVDKDIHTDVAGIINRFNYTNYIEIYDTSNTKHVGFTSEIFVNVWGSGTDKVAFGIRTDLAISNIKKVIIKANFTIPKYTDNYSKLGQSDYADSWFKITEDVAFYSSKDGSFYLGSNLSVVKYATSFADAMSEVCSGYDGVSSNLSRLANKFYAFENIYTTELTSDQKAELASSSDQDVLDMLTRYDYVINKYPDLSNFLNRTRSARNSILIMLGLNIDESSGGFIFVAIFSIISIGTLTMYLVRKKKKR